MYPAQESRLVAIYLQYTVGKWLRYQNLGSDLRTKSGVRYILGLVSGIPGCKWPLLPATVCRNAASYMCMFCGLTHSNQVTVKCLYFESAVSDKAIQVYCHGILLHAMERATEIWRQVLKVSECLEDSDYCHYTAKLHRSAGRGSTYRSAKVMTGRM